MVGRDTPEPIRSGRPCKTSHGAGCGQRTENPPALAVGSVKLEEAELIAEDLLSCLRYGMSIIKSHHQGGNPDGGYAEALKL